MENHAGPPPQDQKVEIVHGFELHLDFTNRLRFLFNKKVTVMNYIVIDAPAKPVSSRSNITIEKFRIEKWWHDTFKKNAPTANKS